jgi:hypothetical protein
MLLGISGLHVTCFPKFQVAGILFWKGIKRHYLYQETLKNLFQKSTSEKQEWNYDIWCSSLP